VLRPSRIARLEPVISASAAPISSVKPNGNVHIGAPTLPSMVVNS
jgi:hypothetical protein